MNTNSLIERLELAKRLHKPYGNEHPRGVGFNEGLDAAIAIVRQCEILDNKDDFDSIEARKDLPDAARELLKKPVVQSLLYDINLLPEQITTAKHWFYMLSVLAHMDSVMKPVVKGDDND